MIGYPRCYTVVAGEPDVVFPALVIDGALVSGNLSATPFLLYSWAETGGPKRENQS